MIKLIESCDEHGMAALLLGLFILSIVGTVAHVIIRLVLGYPPNYQEGDECDIEEDDYDE